MNNITINSKKHTIEMTKKFAKAASNAGSEEYTLLQRVRKDYPNYHIVTKSTTAKKKESFKGLTFEYMEKYIAAHDSEDQKIMAEYMMMRGTSEEAQAMLADSMSYHEIKDWFLKKYPEIAEFHQKREALVA